MQYAIPSFLPSFLCKKSRRRAFTLSELLIALAILGLIATFTIPKVLQSTGDSKYKAVAKETIGAVVEKLNAKFVSGEGNADLVQYLFGTLNYQKKCTDMMSEGCIVNDLWDTLWNNRPGIVMHNGSIIYMAYVGYGCGSCSNEGQEFIQIVVDADGDNASGSTDYQYHFYYEGAEKGMR